MEMTPKIDRLLRTVLVRAVQLANVEGASGTSSLLSSAEKLTAYLNDERTWGVLQDEIRAMRDYAEVLRGCFGVKSGIVSNVPIDHFVHRRMLLEAYMDACALDRFLDHPDIHETETDISLSMGLEPLLCLHVRLIGEGRPYELECELKS